MKYKASLIICAAVIVVFAFSFFFSPEVAVSELENRNMTTFKMVLDPVDDIDPNTGEKSVLYNADKSIPDRLEDAMKDQIFIRDLVVLNYTNLEAKLANLYSGTVKLLSAPFSGDKLPDDETADETEPPEVTVPDDGFPDEYYDLAADVSNIPEELDFKKYPGYGYPRLATFPARSYTYSNIGGFAAYNDTEWVGEKPSKGSVRPEQVQKHVDQYNKILSVYPDMKIYNYFVSGMQNTPWFLDFYGYYPDRQEQAAQYLPEYINAARLTFNDFEDYSQCCFKTDHHWAYKGSERGYQDVYNMMAEDLDLSPMKYPIKTWNFSEIYGVKYRGSRASSLRGIYSAYDEFIAYEYDLGERQTFVVNPKKLFNEIPVTMGLWEKYKAGEIRMNADHYISFYGNCYDTNGNTYADSAYMLVIKNNNGAAHNLLLICDSTQRGYRDVLGSHFNTLVTLDYRIMAEVPVDRIIEEYSIDTILVGGLTFFWSGQDQYMLKFSDDFGK